MYDEKDYVWWGCLLQFIVVVITIAVSAWSVDYTLMFFLGKDIPLFWDIVIGTLGGQVTIPVAIILVILRHLGVL